MLAKDMIIVIIEPYNRGMPVGVPLMHVGFSSKENEYK